MTLLVNQHCECMLIDSHSHLDTGAIIATTSENKLHSMVNYIQEMIVRDWGNRVQPPFDVTIVIIYKEMFLGCDWLIRVQLIPNITQNSAKICNTVQKSVTTVQKSVTTVQKSVTTVQKSVISSLSDGIYSLKNQKYGGRIFTFA